MIIYTYDDKGNHWDRDVKIVKDQLRNRHIISILGPIEYSYKTLARHYPYEKRFCIDLSGRIHEGHPVYISHEHMNKLIEWATVYIVASSENF